MFPLINGRQPDPCHGSIDQSPPKREYKVSDPKVRDLTLAELDLAPSSVLMIKFEDDRFNRKPSVRHVP